MRLAIAALALVLGAAAACGSDGLLPPPLGLAHAAASATCAPTDGPATSIYLSPQAITSLEPAGPHVRLHVWRAIGELPGTWSLAASRGEGGAVRYGAAGEIIDQAATGSVTVIAVGEDRSVVGTVDLVFASGERIHGGFTARWIQRLFVCG